VGDEPIAADNPLGTRNHLSGNGSISPGCSPDFIEAAPRSFGNNVWYVQEKENEEWLGDMIGLFR
jgi:hypothetical protein